MKIDTKANTYIHIHMYIYTVYSVYVLILFISTYKISALVSAGIKHINNHYGVHSGNT